MKQIICMKWGSLYGSDYVNKLYNMCEKNISDAFRFVCLTDDCSNLKKEIETFSCPKVKNTFLQKIIMGGEKFHYFHHPIIYLV